MNEKDTRGKAKDLKKKGFYVALYSCIGVILMIAVVVGYTNLNNGTTGIPNGDEVSLGNEPEVEVKDVNQSNKYPLEIGEIGSALSSDIRDDIISKKPSSAPTPSAETPASSETATQSGEQKNPNEPQKPSSPEKQDSDGKKDSTTIVTPEDKGTAIEENKNNLEIEVIDSNPKENKSFTVYDDKQKMLWPVLGEIVMDFSTDTLVYDKTLEQYRTNDNICISAPSGTQVRAAAEGIVADVTKTKELGNTVVVDHGNGWVTTYSQLQDNILVSVGDVVESGQILGGVGEPSIYSVLLGSHLNFEVLRDDTPINPKNILANN